MLGDLLDRARAIGVQRSRRGSIVGTSLLKPRHSS